MLYPKINRYYPFFIENVSEHDQAIYNRDIQALAQQFETWVRKDSLTNRVQILLQLTHFFLEKLHAQLDDFARIHHMHEAFSQDYQLLKNKSLQAEAIQSFSRQLGASEKKAKQDKKLFSKGILDTVAMEERVKLKRAQTTQLIQYILQRMAYYVACLCDASHKNDPQLLLIKSNFNPIMSALLSNSVSDKIKLGALQALGGLITAYQKNSMTFSLPDNVIQQIMNLQNVPGEDIWLTCEAMRIIQLVNPLHFKTITCNELVHYDIPDHYFVRHRIILLIGTVINQDESYYLLLKTCLKDPSPHVRQAIAKIIYAMNPEKSVEFFRLLALEDNDASVRTRAMLTFYDILAKHPQAAPDLIPVVIDILRNEKNSGCFKTALDMIEKAYTHLKCVQPYCADLITVIESIAITQEEIKLRRACSYTLLQLKCLNDSEQLDLKNRFIPLINQVQPGETKKFPLSLIGQTEHALLGKVLASITAKNWGVSIAFEQNHLYITRGFVFKKKLWRFLYELLHPRTNKRQAISHCTGRVLKGTLHAPSTLLCEASASHVPGEPLLLPDEDGWRPFLPLVDDLIDLKKTAFDIYSLHGVTHVALPTEWKGRIKCYWQLSKNFLRLADLRNWTQEQGIQPDSYVKSLKKLGIHIKFQPYQQDASVQKFFSAANVGFVTGYFNNLHTYFISLYQNSLSQLGLFLAIVLALFLFQHIWRYKKIRKCRKNIPFSIGGWGTRGKSGTERLKAALLHGLGMHIFSKSTGCEAMVVHGIPGDRLYELFLYRPYDKATIWEQANVLEMASQFKADKG